MKVAHHGLCTSSLWTKATHDFAPAFCSFRIVTGPQMCCAKECGRNHRASYLPVQTKGCSAALAVGVSNCVGSISTWQTVTLKRVCWTRQHEGRLIVEPVDVTHVRCLYHRAGPSTPRTVWLANIYTPHLQHGESLWTTLDQYQICVESNPLFSLQQTTPFRFKSCYCHSGGWYRRE